ncbi:TetR/AcrR family transcriptional regulator [Caulobacter segnis]|uniref:TetR/AcrR family transcriptional regulator n=1 Tax=Caulobacter segnis TaxID=88688 RepID=UPI00285744BD|nr:TetR/AcrR family transcriptional regulator [Caulobacter segnis]MDR6624465.1 AcrR family transcriptional regulator [Caulobacter segnis]
MPDLNSSLRADAQANRDRILEVARAAFAADPNVSLNAIAKSAGVGAGTLYRHYPTREALVQAVYSRQIETLVELAPSLLGRHRPLAAFRIWCEQLAEFGREKHGVSALLKSPPSDRELQDFYGPLLAAVTELLRACENSGDIHPGVTAMDFLMLVSFLWQIPPDTAGKVRTARLLELVFRGMKTNP